MSFGQYRELTRLLTHISEQITQNDRLMFEYLHILEQRGSFNLDLLPLRYQIMIIEECQEALEGLKYCKIRGEELKREHREIHDITFSSPWYNNKMYHF